MKFWLSNIFLFCSVLLLSQKKDQNVTDYTNKTEVLPFLKYERNELDTLMTYNKIIPLSAEGTGSYCYRIVSFNVDRFGKINNIKHLSSIVDLPNGRSFKNSDAEPKLHEELRKETERLIMLTEGLWFSDSTREKESVILNVTYKSSSRKDLEENPDRIYSANPTTSIFTKKDLYNYGVKKMASNKIILAKIYFEQALLYFPKDIDAHYNLATCYYKLKRKDDACAEWKKCLELGDNTVTTEIEKYCK